MPKEGFKHSKETKKKMSEAKKGKNNSFYGKHHTKETKQKISEIHRNKEFTTEYRKKLSKATKGKNNPMYGKCHTEESKTKMSKTHKNKYIGENNPFFGKHHVAETRRKISEANRNRIPWNKGKKCLQFTGINHPNYKHGLSKTKEYMNAKNMKRYARKRNQTLQNADQAKVLKIYRFCTELNQLGGEKFVVDHIQPLSHGGLHCEDNLQILKKSLNGEKFNKWPLTPAEKIKYQGITLTDIETQEENSLESMVENIAL